MQPGRVGWTEPPTGTMDKEGCGVVEGLGIMPFASEGNGLAPACKSSKGNDGNHC